ncbi:MAG: 2-isopropylmalate synthase [Streptosporangiaceae bacterium]
MHTSIDKQQPSGMPLHKYRRYEPISFHDRTWPEKVPSRAPIWTSVDLRDGSQALIDPMGVDRKRRMYDHLVEIGFKEIEVGFPLSCQADWDFTRHVIENDLVPDDVTIQVMTPVREGMIEDTVKALRGATRAILQIYHPTSTTQRRVVLRMSRAEVRNLALHGADTALKLRDSLPGTEIYLQYATESFTQTEPEFALEVCNAVLEQWDPSPEDQVRVVFPTTVECFPPHEFADRIEWMSRNLLYRDAITLTLHPHNDRGTGVAATELALLAGAERVEGTLLGNGERAGNVCLITLAMNLFSQGIDPKLDLSNLDETRRVVESCNQLPVSVRHPWVGDFVYTSFAGSHQDAISKGLSAYAASNSQVWDVPYLPIDPRDVGRDYQALIRINRQSGKGGVAHIIRADHGLDLPRRMQIEFAALVQERAEQGGEIAPDEIWETFSTEYLGDADNRLSFPAVPVADAQRALTGLLRPHELAGVIQDLHWQRPTPELSANWVAYAEVRTDERVRWGAGIARSEEEALARCLHSAVRRLLRATREG